MLILDWNGSVLWDSPESVSVKGALEKAVEADVDLRDAQLAKASLVGAQLDGARLNAADLHSANLTGAHLRGAHLEDANLQCASVRSADLSGANLQWADLSGADLREANLSDAKLAHATLVGADLSQSNLVGTQRIARAAIKAETPRDPKRAVSAPQEDQAARRADNIHEKVDLALYEKQLHRSREAEALGDAERAKKIADFRAVENEGPRRALEAKAEAERARGDLAPAKPGTPPSWKDTGRD